MAALDAAVEELLAVSRLELGSAAAAPDAGVGLGLAIVRQIARHHGGEVRVRSRDGGGSVFEVSLPGREAHK